MKYLLIISLFPFYCFSQDAKTLVVHGDTLWFKNITQNDSIQLTKTGGTTQSWTNKTLGSGSVWNGNAIGDAYVSSASTWNAKQTALSGTGFVKISGTTISYDNSTYLSSIDTTNISNFFIKARASLGTLALQSGTFSGVSSGTNTGDNSTNSTYSSDYRAANFIAGTNYLAPAGNGSQLTNMTASQVGLTNVTNTSDANKPVSTAQQTALDLKANLASPSFSGTVTEGTVTQTGKTTTYNNIATVGVGMPSLVATIDATGQTANINTATLYAVPAAGFYRVSIYITVTSAGTTSTMPSTTITYTDGNAGTNSHATTTTATSAGNSVTTTFAQTTYILYAKASTNIQYATGSYASTGSAMQYALRIRVEAI